MAAACPLARSLLALVCFALLAGCARKGHKHHPEHSGQHSLPNCAEYSEGTITRDVLVLDTINTPPYKSPFQIHITDLCGSNRKKLVGFLIEVCDPLGPPGPSFKVHRNLKLSVKCYTDGPCPSGLTVKVSQYCSLH